ncbi:MAG: CoB--CoM heterodisulfide reductase iron-sulfur subunit B family protein [Candidatus Hodarchaeales archaeon]|jgi:heterodisulfide reductase subunit B
MVKYALFLGCTIPMRFPFMESASRRLMDYLGVEYDDVPEFTCCPDPVGIQSIHKKTWLALAARNLAIAEQNGFDTILTLCNGCFETLKVANHELIEEPEVLKIVNDINKVVNREYNGTVKVKHFHEVLYDDIGVKRLREKITTPIDFKIATHTGCHLLRPHEILKVDDPEFPTELDQLAEVTGVKSVHYLQKNMCCGAGIRGCDDGADSYAIAHQKLKNMKKAGAQALIVECPTCLGQFDAGQRVIKKQYGEDFELPVIYLSELLAVAMGIDVSDGLKLHAIKTKSVLTT